MYGPDVALVQSTWAQVHPIGDRAAQLLYDKLFEIDPSLQSLFAQANMAAERKRVIQIITVVVRGLDQLDELLPAIESLGRRHSGYGLMDRQYTFVGAALLWTLEEILGAAFTPQARSAWTRTYGMLAAVMQQGARRLAA